MAVYVDDILIFSAELRAIKDAKALISGRFQIWDLGEVRSYLGVRVTRDAEGSVMLDQEAYLNEVLKRFGMEGSKPVNTPLCPSQRLDRPKVPVEKESKPYQALIGSLMYLSVFTRPDITYAVSVLSQFNNEFGEEHWTAAKRVLRYLKGTADRKLKFSKGDDLKVFADADWGNCVVDRKSYSGYVATICNGAVAWRSKKQSNVALSSTEAEIVSLSEACKESTFLIQLQQELLGGRRPPVTVFCDNQAAIANIQEGHHSKKLRHVDMRQHYIKDLISDQLAQVSFVSTSEMLADIMTKALSGPQHAIFAKKIGMV